MFDQVVLRSAEEGTSITAGQVAEALLFYQKVHLVLDNRSIQALLKTLGGPGLISLLSRDDISATQTEEILGTRAVSTPPLADVYDYIATLIAGNVNKPELKLNTRKKRLVHWLNRWGGDLPSAIEYSDKFIALVPARSFTKDDFLKKGVLRAAMEDVQDKDFLHEATRCVLAKYGVNAGAFRFETAQTAGGLHVVTDLDFAKLKSVNENLTPAHVLTETLSARADLTIAAHYGGEFRTSALTSEIIQIRYAEVLRRAGISAKELTEFQRIVVPNYPTIKEVIDGGSKSFEEFLEVLEKARRFRRFLVNINPDAKLVGEYFAEVTAEGWINRLPTKAIRYVIGIAIEAAVPLAGLVYSGADAFLMDRVLGGWKPSHFVDKQLKPFLEGDK